jgi:hypothetical protein
MVKQNLKLKEARAAKLELLKKSRTNKAEVKAEVKAEPEAEPEPEEEPEEEQSAQYSYSYDYEEESTEEIIKPIKVKPIKAKPKQTKNNEIDELKQMIIDMQNKKSKSKSKSNKTVVQIVNPPPTAKKQKKIKEPIETEAQKLMRKYSFLRF